MSLRRRTSARVIHDNQIPKPQTCDVDQVRHIFSRCTGKKNKCVFVNINSRVDVPDFIVVKKIASVYCYKLYSSSEKYDIDSKSTDYHLVFVPI